MIEYNPSSMQSCFSPSPEILDIEKFEKDFHLVLPDEYRAFLLQINGGEPKNRYFHTMDNKVLSLVSIFFPLLGNGDDNLYDEFSCITMQEELPSNVMTIASIPNGNRVVMSFNGDDKGSIYYWSWDEEPELSSCSYKYMRKVSDNFYDFFTNLTLNR
jgi:hypothetical protein